MKFTPSQGRAIFESGNLIVVAGAGAGKTRTLVQRCSRFLSEGPERARIDELLVVTFTEAAATEVRDRLRKSIEAEYEKNRDAWLFEQIARLESAYVSTLHSFCFRLIRENFAELELDPGVGVLQAEEARVLFGQTLDQLLKEHYEGKHPHSARVQELILNHFGGRDQELRKLLRDIHEHTQTLPDPKGWFASQQACFASCDCAHWKQWFVEALVEWAAWWKPVIDGLPVGNQNAHFCGAILHEILASGPRDAGSYEKLKDIPARVLDRKSKFERGKTEEQRAPLEKFFDQAEALAGFVKSSENFPDPLQHDWDLCRESLLATLELAGQFESRFTEAKRDCGGIDFHDLEQLALDLVWDRKAAQPTPLARQWQQRFKHVIVDEYQDINRAQDCILQALSRPEGNRFLVGDNKQSIYRFRQADPNIFNQYRRLAQAGHGWKDVVLSENFRSREKILQFVNDVFGRLMRTQLGGIAYDQTAALLLGNCQDRQHLADPDPAVEIHLLVESEGSPEQSQQNGSTDNEDAQNGEPAVDLEKVEKEARIVAAIARDLKEKGYLIWDDRDGQPFQRPVQYKDMVILLRAPKNKVDAYAKAFEIFGVPLSAKRNAFYSTTEVLDLLNLLYVLDNPFQDVPLLAVLRSPFVGLSPNDLAEVRAAARHEPFYKALNVFLNRKAEGECREKITTFLKRFESWRAPENCFSLSKRIERILAETYYDQWVLTQPQGPQRYQNLQQLLRLAREFDHLKGEGLYQFLQHIKELQDEVGDIEPPPLENGDAVRLMSIHQSKGLEFPIVFLTDCGKQFNLLDSRASTLLDECYGLCAKIKPEKTGRHYKSLPLFLAQHRELKETIAEEQRILYVAMTRARERLIITGAISQKHLDSWAGQASPDLTPQNCLESKSYLHWLVPLLAGGNPGFPHEPEGKQDLYTWKKWETPPVPDRERDSAGAAKPELSRPALTPGQIAALKQKLDFVYPYRASVLQAAKTSVSRLRRAMQAEEEASYPIFVRHLPGEDPLQKGLANHLFLELLNLDSELDAAALSTQLSALGERGLIAPEQLTLVNIEAVAAFWASSVGRLLLAQRSLIQREFPFTFRIGKAEAELISKDLFPNLPPEDYVIIQGIADLILVKPDEVWLLDFKTDSLSGPAVQKAVEKYKPQIDLYSLALKSIFNRPVSRRWLHFLSAHQTVEL